MVLILSLVKTGIKQFIVYFAMGTEKKNIKCSLSKNISTMFVLILLFIINNQHISDRQNTSLQNRLKYLWRNQWSNLNYFGKMLIHNQYVYYSMLLLIMVIREYWGILMRVCGSLKMVAWYFEEGVCYFEEVMWYFEECGLVLWRE